MPTQTYDYFVIGTGPAGQSVAEAAARNGKTVGIVDYQPFGGTCTLRGCDPKLFIHAAAKAMDYVQRLQGKGFTSLPEFSWQDVQAFRATYTDPIPEKTQEKFDRLEIDAYHGKARFTAPGKLRIDDKVDIEAGRVIIAAGGKPMPFDFPGAELMKTSDDFLYMDALPKHVVIIGGGYIGSEFAHISRVLGAEVTVIAADNNPVSQFDRDLNTLLAKAAEDRGMTLHFGMKATEIVETPDGVRVTAEHRDGTELVVEGSAAFHCAGRAPNIDHLNLKAAGLEHSKKGIKVNNRLATNVPNHYALGDCADAGLDLTPIANREADILINNLFGDATAKIDYYPVPTVAYTLPPIGSVGMTAEEADKSKKKYHINYAETSEDHHNYHQGCPVAGHKIIIDPEKKTIVGAHLIGAGTEEILNLFALAIYEETPVAELRRRLWVYPSGGGKIGSMCKLD